MSDIRDTNIDGDIDLSNTSNAGVLDEYFSTIPESFDFMGTKDPVAVADRPDTSASSLELETPQDFVTGPQTVASADLEMTTSRYVQPTISYPSDKMILRTFGIPANQSPIMLVNRQVDGMACRVRVRNVHATAPLWVLTDNEQAGPSAVATQVYPTGFYLPPAQSALSEIDISTRSALYAIVPGATDGLVAVVVETYLVP